LIAQYPALDSLLVCGDHLITHVLLGACDPENLPGETKCSGFFFKSNGVAVKDFRTSTATEY
jgi:hypothetical protein